MDQRKVVDWHKRKRDVGYKFFMKRTLQILVKREENKYISVAIYDDDICLDILR